MHPRKNLHRQPINIGKQLLQTIVRSKNTDQISMGHQNNKKLTKYTEKQNPNYPIKQTIAR